MNSLIETLQKYWNYNQFRNGQQEIIESIIAQNDTLVVMPTGGGKSLCYQLPALIMDGTAIVISPLIALMKDQVDALRNLNISATLINSSIPYEEMYLRMEDALRGRYKLIYIAPERLESMSFIRLINKLNVSFIAVDEAHCISEWGHDFRPSYLNISKRLKKSGNYNFIALTATATPEVRIDIAKQLEFYKFNSFVRGFDRPNLSFYTENTEDKLERTYEIISDTHEGSTIVYCGSRKRAEKFTKELREKKIFAEVYHGGLQPLMRKTIQERFIDSQTNVIVATNAFGMGIDKADVRNVIHLDLTQTLEAYYQEAGRAGRDGKDACCYMIYQPSDINLQDFFLKTTHPAQNEIIAVYDYFRLYNSNKINSKNTNIPIDISDIAEETSLSKKAIANIIKLLEKYNIITINKASATGLIRFTASMDRIREFFEHTSDIRKNILESLLRNLSRNAFYEDTSVDLAAIRNSYSIKEDDFNREILSLQYDNIIKYTSASITTNVSLLFDGDLQKSELDFDGIERRRQYANTKLNKVIEYAETNKCKRNFILEYFQEDEIFSTCGICSSCKNPEPSKIENEQTKFIKINILSTVAELNGNFSKNTISDILSGKITKQIISFKLNYLPLFGSCKKINVKLVKKAMEDAIRYRLLEIRQTKYRPVVITESGIDYIKSYNNSITKLPDPTASHILHNDDNNCELYSILNQVRKEFAEKKGIQVRAVISDRALKEITKMKPLNKRDISTIKGVNQYFINNYSSEFLSHINICKIQHYLEYLDKELIHMLFNEVPISTISKNLKLSIFDISSRIKEIIELGANPDLDYLYSQETFSKICSFLSARPRATIKTIRKELQLTEDYAIIRIMLANAKTMI